jgi:hypothetical protein
MSDILGSMKSFEVREPVARDQPIASGGGVELAAASERDPYQLLIELMAVVEELCPRWPDRETFERSHTFLL